MEKAHIQALEEVGLTPEDAEMRLFDPTEGLTSPAAVAAFLDEAVSTGDAKFVIHCLGLVAKAVGKGQVTGLSGAARQALSRALSGTSEPRIETLFAVLDALGMRMHINRKPVG